MPKLFPTRFGYGIAKELTPHVGISLKRERFAGEPPTVVEPKVSEVTVLTYRGFLFEVHPPHDHCVVTHRTGGEIPEALRGTFTNRWRLMTAIDNFLNQQAKEERA